MDNREEIKQLKNIAIVNSQSNAALIEAFAMNAENQYRIARGETIEYNDEAFFELINRYNLNYNSVINQLNKYD